MKNKFVNGFIIAALLLGAAFVAVKPVQAYEYDQDGQVAEGEVVNDDLILVGQQVVMEGTINGLLLASAQDIVINGTVNGDAFLFGQTVTIGEGGVIKGNLFTGAQTVNNDGKVEGSFFTGTMATTLKDSAVVSRNLYFGGYSLEILKGAEVGKDLAAGGYQVIISGKVDRDVNVDVGALKINGTVGRNVDAKVAEPSAANQPPFISQPNMPMTITPGLHISESAKILGNLNYTSPIPQRSQIQGQPSGIVTYRTPVPNEKDELRPAKPEKNAFDFFAAGVGRIIKGMARNFISIFLLGALALWLIPSIVKSITETMRTRPLPSAGYGILTYILGWVGVGIAGMVIIAVTVILAFISLGGLSGFVFWTGTSAVVVFLTFFGMMISLGSKVLVSYLVGNWILKKLTNKTEVNPYLSLLVGVVIYTILRAVPVLGWLVAAFVIVIGLGATWLYLIHLRNKPAQLAV